MVKRLQVLDYQQKEGNHVSDFLLVSAESEAPLAEGEGFKPPIPERGLPDFESSAIDHSANLPMFVCEP